MEMTPQTPKDESLSSKIEYGLREVKDNYNQIVSRKNFQSIDIAYVKEAVKKLKDETEVFDGWNFKEDAEAFRKIIDEIFGDKLT